MPTHLDFETQSGAPPPPFVQVLYIGRFSSPEFIATLRRDGVGVIAAFDSQRGAELLQHFRPDAILCGSADVDSVLAYAAPDIPVIPVAGAPLSRAEAAETPRRDALEDDALVRRIRREIAAKRQLVQTPASCHGE